MSQVDNLSVNETLARLTELGITPPPNLAAPVVHDMLKAVLGATFVSLRPPEPDY